MPRKTFFLLMIFLLLAGCGGRNAAATADAVKPSSTPIAATRTFAPPIFVRSPTPTPAPSQALAAATPLVSPTDTLVPTATFTPTLTPTSIFYRRTFDVLIGDYYKFIIHKAKPGERLEDFAATYNTTVEAIIAINYHLTNPVWADMIFVVPVNFSDVSGMPMFVVYQIKPEERGISVELLAKKLRVDLFDLKYYNGLTAPGQRPLVGDLILVPWWPDQDRKIIIDGPDLPDD